MRRRGVSSRRRIRTEQPQNDDETDAAPAISHHPPPAMYVHHPSVVYVVPSEKWSDIPRTCSDYHSYVDAVESRCAPCYPPAAAYHPYPPSAYAPVLPVPQYYLPPAGYLPRHSACCRP